MRNACPARFFVFKVLFFKILPPDISCFGATCGSHEQKCFSLGNFDISVPTSMMTVCASDTPKPSTKLKSTPLIRFTLALAGSARECCRISCAFSGALLRQAQYRSCCVYSASSLEWAPTPQLPSPVGSMHTSDRSPRHRLQAAGCKNHTTPGIASERIDVLKQSLALYDFY